MANARFVLKSLKTGKERELSEKTLAGRGLLDGISLESESTSRKHAVITVVSDLAYVEDTSSSNGTFVNGERISAKRQINPGDRIEFSDEAFELARVAQQGAATVVRHQPQAVSREPAPAAVPWPDVEWDEKDHTKACTPEQLREFQRRSNELRAANLAAPPVSVPCLVFRDPDKTVPLTLNEGVTQEWIIGRRPDCAICIESERVSAVHAKIVRTGPQWIAIDALSSNGMYVNNYPAGKQYLSAGDLLRFGDVECIFRLPPHVAPKRIAPGMRYVLIGVAACIVALLIGLLVF